MHADREREAQTMDYTLQAVGKWNADPVNFH